MAGMIGGGFQIALPLVSYEIEKEVIHQRIADGYVNATAMCKAAGKEWSNYFKSDSAKAFAEELSRSLRIGRDLLIVSITVGPNELRGTWVHPQVAINLAQWISPKFAVQVTQWVFDWMEGRVPGGNLPYHLRRYMANMHNVPPGYFSMLNEITIALIAPLEQMGYALPDSMLPDISEGRMFSKWLRDNGFNPDAMPCYPHVYEDGRTVPARAYPNSLLHHFRRHFVEVWMTTRALPYFGERDPKAVPHLERLLALPNYRDIAGFIEG